MLGYSDDLSAIVEGQLPMFLLLNKVKKRLAEVGIKMNIEKSAAMEILPSNRHQRKNKDSIYNIPAVTSYKYLGIEIDSTL